MKTTLITLALSFLSLTGFAQVPVTLPDSIEIPATADFTTMPQSIDGYKTIEHKGFGCEVPYGAEISMAQGLKAAYPDGSFATMLTVEEGRGYNQKRALDICRDTARTLQMSDTKVSKVKINGINGAIATGELENLHVTLVVLPSNDAQLTCLMLNSDVRSEWADNVLRTLKHK
ncbi:MAG: hypothetical protein K2K26_11455 [Muribaculaceae bacterium]|nr:hypothetical protein [Muribaculaceae bacterium]